LALSDSDVNSTRLERLCSTAAHGAPAAGRFVSGRDVADVWAAEGCAFKTTCNTYARFSVPGAANTAGRKSGSVAVDARGAAVTAAWPAGSVSARYLDEWFGCQLSFSSAQARARLRSDRVACSALGRLPLPLTCGQKIFSGGRHCLGCVYAGGARYVTYTMVCMACSTRKAQ